MSRAVREGVSERRHQQLPVRRVVGTRIAEGGGGLIDEGHDLGEGDASGARRRHEDRVDVVVDARDEERLPPPRSIRSEVLGGQVAVPGAVDARHEVGDTMPRVDALIGDPSEVVAQGVLHHQIADRRIALQAQGPPDPVACGPKVRMSPSEASEAVDHAEVVRIDRHT